MIRILPKSNGIGPGNVQNFRAPGAIVILGILLELVSPAARGQEFRTSPFVLRNHSPFSAIIGTPSRWPDGTTNIAELSWNVSNHSFFDDNGSESLQLDGETHTLSARLQYRLSQHIQLGVDIPWLAHSGGFLDGTIDGWHELIGFSEGIRPHMPRNELQHVLEIAGTEKFRLDNSVSGIGDIRFAIAFDLGNPNASPNAAYLKRIPWTLTLSMEAPTGKIEKLTGNDSADLAAGLGIRSPKTAGGRIHWWLDMGLVWPGDVDIDGLDTAGQIYYYDAAFAWRFQRRFDFLLQVAGNTAPYQSNIKMLGDPAAQVAIGGLWHLSSHYGLRFGIIEDLRAKTAPDVGFELTLIFGIPGRN